MSNFRNISHCTRLFGIGQKGEKKEKKENRMIRVVEKYRLSSFLDETRKRERKREKKKLRDHNRVAIARNAWPNAHTARIFTALYIL